MLIHYFKAFIISIKKHRFFYLLNLIGFFTGFLLLTVISTFVYQELSFDHFHKNMASIYRIGAEGYGVTPLCFLEKLKDQVPEIKSIIRFSSGKLVIKDKNGVHELDKIKYTDPDVFKVFSFRLLSRNPEEVLNKPFTIVLNQSMARKIYGNTSPIGQTLTSIDGSVYMVTGVMEDIPYNSHIQSNAFVSMETLRYNGDENISDCGAWASLTYLHLVENADNRDIEKKINTILEPHGTKNGERNIPIKLESLKAIYFDGANNIFDGSVHGNLRTVILYVAISILVLLIVVINYINLATAISGSKSKEIAIRKINGAGQTYIILHSMFEALGIAVLSFFGAVVLIELIFPQLCSLLNMPITFSFNRLSLYMIFFAGIVLIGLLSGLIPGIFQAKTNVIKALKNEAVFKSSGIGRKILLVIQMLIVAVLLNSAFIINNRLTMVLNKDNGFDFHNIVCFQLNEELLGHKAIFKHDLLANPNIRSVTFSNQLISTEFSKRPYGEGENTKLCYFIDVDPDYLNIYKIKIRDGRNFSWEMITDFSNSCIINDAAYREFDLKSPVNRTFAHKRIIGVVTDFHYSSMYNKVEPLVIFCSNDGNIAQVKLSAINQNASLKYMKEIIENLSSNYEFNYTFLADKIRECYQPEMELKSSFHIYSGVAFIIALLGLFGLTLFTIQRKIKEVSFRKLFGARLIDTLKRLTREQFLIVIIASCLSIPITILVTCNWLNNFQFKIQIDYWIFFKTFCIMAVATLLAVSFLIIKTHKMHLIESLKQE